MDNDRLQQMRADLGRRLFVSQSGAHCQASRLASEKLRRSLQLSRKAKYFEEGFLVMERSQEVAGKT